MGCSGSKGQGAGGIEVGTSLANNNGNNKVTLYADYFSSDSRSVASILDLCDIKFEYKQINTLEG